MIPKKLVSELRMVDLLKSLDTIKLRISQMKDEKLRLVAECCFDDLCGLFKRDVPVKGVCVKEYDLVAKEIIEGVIESVEVSGLCDNCNNNADIVVDVVGSHERSGLIHWVGKRIRESVQE